MLHIEAPPQPSLHVGNGPGGEATCLEPGALQELRDAGHTARLSSAEAPLQPWWHVVSRLLPLLAGAGLGLSRAACHLGFGGQELTPWGGAPPYRVVE